MQGPNRLHLYALFFGVVVAIIGTAIFFAIQAVWGQDTQEWNCVVTDPLVNIYDGDTIKDVRVLIRDYDFKESEYGLIWPGIHITERGIEFETDIRISGVDTPEKRALSKYSDGTPRSQRSRQLERDAAAEAKQALYEFLGANKFEFTLSNVELGKYAGRVIGDVSVKGRDVAEFLIEQELAFPYDGGTKKDWARYLDMIHAPAEGK
ncbi:hypothetical protein F4Z99_19245 [Candidatus Poribacteria bacterium]|nr:hypothetical protein [Candidatus Poribacteria bacterium]MYB00388.1 hypothetical protein [Candidatus Poribacteria bacterium]